MEFFFFSSRRRHTRSTRDWSSDVCSSDLGQNPGLGGTDREVREETRTLPVGDAGQQNLVEVAKHVRERLRPVGRRGGKARANLTRLHLRQNRQLADALEVARSPLQCGGTVLAEGHFKRFLIWGQVRVLSTCSFVSQARRACATPISTCSR